MPTTKYPWEVWTCTDYEGWTIQCIFETRREAEEYAVKAKDIQYADMMMGEPERYYQVRKGA